MSREVVGRIFPVFDDHVVVRVDDLRSSRSSGSCPKQKVPNILAPLHPFCKLRRQLNGSQLLEHVLEQGALIGREMCVDGSGANRPAGLLAHLVRFLAEHFRKLGLRSRNVALAIVGGID